MRPSVFPIDITSRNKKEVEQPTGNQCFHLAFFVFFFVFRSKWTIVSTSSFSVNSISSENGPCVGTSSSAQNYCNYCKMEKQTNK